MTEDRLSGVRLGAEKVDRGFDIAVGPGDSGIRQVWIDVRKDVEQLVHLVDVGRHLLCKSSRRGPIRLRSSRGCNLDRIWQPFTFTAPWWSPLKPETSTAGRIVSFSRAPTEVLVTTRRKRRIAGDPLNLIIAPRALGWLHPQHKQRTNKDCSPQNQ